VSQNRPSWLDSLKPCLKDINSKRIYSNGRRIEVIYTVKATNFSVLRNNDVADINVSRLIESGLEVPVIMPQKLEGVMRRRMLQIIRDYRDSGADLKRFIEKAAKFQFTKAIEHLENGWECTIQPSLSEKNEKVTDLGMDGYCPVCTLFGVALVEGLWKVLYRTSVGIKKRIRFDPAFAVFARYTPLTHIKVSDGSIRITGGSLFTETHVEPGTMFVGRLEIADVTEPELLSLLYTLATTQEIGGGSALYGTIRINLIGIRCGKYGITTAYDLADTLAMKFKGLKDLPTYTALEAELWNELERLNSEVNARFIRISNRDVLQAVGEIDKNNEVMEKLWESALSFVEEAVEHVKKLGIKVEENEGNSNKKRSRKKSSEETEADETDDE